MWSTTYTCAQEKHGRDHCSHGDHKLFHFAKANSNHNQIFLFRYHLYPKIINYILYLTAPL